MRSEIAKAVVGQEQVQCGFPLVAGIHSLGEFVDKELGAFNGGQTVLAG